MRFRVVLYANFAFLCQEKAQNATGIVETVFWTGSNSLMGVTDMLKIIFPLLMVIGATGSLVVNVIEKGEWATSLQWIGAALLYTALMFRNVG